MQPSPSLLVACPGLKLPSPPTHLHGFLAAGVGMGVLICFGFCSLKTHFWGLSSAVPVVRTHASLQGQRVSV